MTGIQVFVLILIGVLGALVLLFFALRQGTAASSEISAGQLFTFKMEIGSAEKASAATALGQAARSRGASQDVAVQESAERLAPLGAVPLTRVLWVDDRPDNNVYEVIGLAHIGVLATVATSNAAARAFLADGRYELLLTDLDRQGDPDNGSVLIQETRQQYPTLPVIVYTSNAASKRSSLLAMGAAAVEDRPQGLLSSVLDIIKAGAVKAGVEQTG